MRTLASYIQEYSESHRHPQNILIHNICVPAIMWSLLGLLSLIPLAGPLNAAHLIVACAMIYYAFFKNLRIWFFMLIVAVLMLLTLSWLNSSARLWWSVSVFTIAWIAQFYGHKIEGKKPSFLKDLQFLLIGPVWVLHKAAPRWFSI